MNMEKTEGTSFIEHYEKLDSIAKQMAAQDRPDLDRIIPLIDEALNSYNAIKERVKSIEALLAQRKVLADGGDAPKD